MNILTLQPYLLALADDQMILSHRNSEWIGHAPILEEDIALANMAQDELGHATLFYNLYCALTGDDPDALVFLREADAFRHVQMVEYPCGDWAFTMLRQYLFDAAEMTLLARLTESAYTPLAETAVKMRNEELYHYRHTSAWLKRLGLGTEESHRRTQTALDTLWPLAQQLFVPLPGEEELVQAGVIPSSAQWKAAWLDVVRPFLTTCSLTIPADDTPPATNRAAHSEHLAPLLADLQKVARLEPNAEW
ncbi:MAG: phenylacetate-CoA oxygenase subunit PaaC [Ardenticatenaceae bacterium]|nr:phenylacetate-CoA oxygenase subunit PaaC [Anaerolineales bacterium]MCB8920427.1 phenylacetate-CoA oxygenase subunit PaaC [Ardenticatenaceae bacterium]MCB8989382.1 phenylacetate-CoA oxygenase subunit PaaC [Ardenticatenaceae bacterium]MCB9004537.1 phenylacetate-CoA oxygenase subunit PaaC [Ardenticatenaceae bacterium]